MKQRSKFTESSSVSTAVLSSAESSPTRRWLGLRLGLCVGLMLMALFAVQAAHAADPSDPPGRVGRVAELQGQVWLFDTDRNEWTQAVRNRPVTTGDRLSTEANGYADVRIGSTALRLAPNTEVEVLRLDDDRMRLQLLNGSVSTRLRSQEAADEFVLETSEGRFRADKAGQYRFDRDDTVSSATVNDGLARYESDGTALAIERGQRIEFWKERGVPQYAITDVRRDEFARWVAALDTRDARSVSARYVSAEMTGVEDLDRYGRWEPDTEYGAVWIPQTVVSGWAPYRMGHWAWVQPWGWTWVDDAPWGFAPFHYGRWVWYRNAWGWAPGRYVARPVYAPALVAWMGGPGVSVSVSVGGPPSVGWFPLGPREVYVPGYRVSPRYMQNVNNTQVTNISNVNLIISNPAQAMANARYVNRGMSRAVTVVPSQVIERRQPVAPAYSPVNDRMIRDMGRVGPRADPALPPPPRAAAGNNGRPSVDPRSSRPDAQRGGPGREPDAGPRVPPAVSPRQIERGVQMHEGDLRGAPRPEVRVDPRPDARNDGRNPRDAGNTGWGREPARPAPGRVDEPGRTLPPGTTAPTRPQPQHQPQVQPPLPPQAQPPVREGREPGRVQHQDSSPPARRIERAQPAAPQAPQVQAPRPQGQAAQQPPAQRPAPGFSPMEPRQQMERGGPPQREMAPRGQPEMRPRPAPEREPGDRGERGGGRREGERGG